MRSPRDLIHLSWNQNGTTLAGFEFRAAEGTRYEVERDQQVIARLTERDGSIHLLGEDLPAAISVNGKEVETAVPLHDGDKIRCHGEDYEVRLKKSAASGSPADEAAELPIPRLVPRTRFMPNDAAVPPPAEGRERRENGTKPSEPAEKHQAPAPAELQPPPKPPELPHHNGKRADPAPAAAPKPPKPEQRARPARPAQSQKAETKSALKLVAVLALACLVTYGLVEFRDAYFSGSDMITPDQAQTAPPTPPPVAKPAMRTTSPVLPRLPGFRVSLKPLDLPATPAPAAAPDKPAFRADFTETTPVEIRKGHGEHLDDILAQTDIFSVVVRLPRDKDETFRRILDAHTRDRVAPHESVRSALSLFRQLRALEALPPSIQFQIDPAPAQQILAALGWPEASATGSLLQANTSEPLHTDSDSIGLKVYQPSAANLGDPAAENNFCYYRTDENAGLRVQLSDETARWLSYGWLELAIDGSGPTEQARIRAIRIQTAGFLEEHDPQAAALASAEPAASNRAAPARDFPCGSKVWSLALSPDGSRIAVARGDSTIALLDADNGKLVGVFNGHTRRVSSVAFSPDGKRLLSGSHDGTMRLWDVASWRELRVFKGHTAEVSSVAFSPDGRRALSGGFDNMVMLWTVETGEDRKWFLGHRAVVTSVAFSPDGRRALSGAADNTVRLWDPKTGKELRCFKGHSSGVQSVAFSPDGRRILSTSGGAASKDGRFVPGIDNTIRIWDAETGEERCRLAGHTAWVLTAAFSPGGTRVLSGCGGTVVNGKITTPGGTDHAVRLWDAETGLELSRFYGHTNLVTKVLFSPDGRSAISGSWDQTVKVWNLPQ
jgi:WD40 repeat protein